MKPTHVRYLVLVMLALAPFCAYLTRNLSSANTTIAQEFRVSDARMGEIIAGFALGYFFFQVPGGILASAYGVRIVLPAIGLAWSGCALWSSLASTPEELQFARVALGFAQAGLVPCCAKAVGDWFPITQRGTVSAVMTGAMQLGAITATALTANLLEPVGWRRVLQGYAGLGIAWAILFHVIFRNRPEEHPLASGAERDLIRAGRPPTSEIAPKTNWPRLALAMLLSVSLWAYFIQAFFRSYAAEFFYAYCPAYLEYAHGVSKEQAGDLASYPLLALTVGCLLAGFVIDLLQAWTGSRWLSRSGASFAGMAICAGCFALATQVQSAGVAVALLSLGALFMAIAGPATWAAGMDLGGRHTPVIVGAMNMVGNIGAYLCPRHVGSMITDIKESGASWDLILWLLAGINAGSAVAWLFVNPRRPVGEAHENHSD
jgi:sugar phosphate permease